MRIAATINRTSLVGLGSPEEGRPIGDPSVEPILKTEELWKVYRTGKVGVAALRGVNFEVLPGEFVAVMGPSGCGKVTLLFLIGGRAAGPRGGVLGGRDDVGT